MLKNIIITATGSDRPGIVSELSNVITKHSGNVEESRMSKMGSDFAIIMLVVIHYKCEESLMQNLQSIKNLVVSTKNTNSTSNYKSEHYTINLLGADNEGIVKVLSEYFANKSINIIELNTHVSPAPVTGTPLFNLKTIIDLPDRININMIQTELDNISNTLGVEINFSKSDPIIKVA